MPNTPYIINGTCKDEDESIISSVTVVASNITNSEKITTTTNASGQYILDLANLTNGYTTGDSIIIYIRSNGYVGEYSFTLSGENKEVNLSTNNQVTASNFREKGWYVFYETLRTGTFAITMTDIEGNSITNADNMFGEFNDKLINGSKDGNRTGCGYPVVIIYTPAISRMGITLEKGQQESDVNFMIEIYHVAARNLKSLVDDVEYQIWKAQEVWNAIGLGNLEMPAGDVDVWEEGSKKIHRITLNANFNLDVTI